MNPEKVYKVLETLDIPYELHLHPATPTVEDALPYWDKISAMHCKNLFFRNHKGNKHYLVVFSYLRQLNIKQLEDLLKQGKLTFASEKRLKKYLGLTPGSVSPFGLINDAEKHVVVFIDKTLTESEKISFHPNLNTATIAISTEDFFKYLRFTGNTYQIIDFKK